MHDETGRLGDDDDVVVVVAHVDVDVRARVAAARSGAGSASTSTISPSCELATLADRPPVDDDRARVEQRLHVAAAPAGEQRDRAVDALAVEHLPGPRSARSRHSR